MIKGNDNITSRSSLFLYPTLLLLSTILLGGCNAESAQQEDNPPPEVDVATVLVEPTTLTETFTGRLEAPETVLLRARVSGYIQEVAFREGEWVEAGDLLFQIDPRPYQNQVNMARAELEQAQSRLQQAESEAERAEQLLAGQAISEEEYDQRQAVLASAKASVSQARAMLDVAELDLQFTRITAPVSGQAGRAQVTRGNMANADQTLLATVVSMNPLHVYFESDENMGISIQSLLAGKERHLQVLVGLSGEEGFPHRAELDYVDNQLNASTGTLQFRAILPNPGKSLKPGQFARVKMPVSRLEQALLVRRQAVQTDQDRRYVYVVEDNGAVSRRQVTTGRQVDDMLVIHEGLAEGDRVIINGLHKVPGAGMKVAPREVSMRRDPATGEVAFSATRP